VVLVRVVVHLVVANWKVQGVGKGMAVAHLGKSLLEALRAEGCPHPAAVF
jgi:hypothetical protein